MASTAPALGSRVRAWRLVWRPLTAGELDHERLWGSLFLLGLGLALAIPEPLRLSLVCPFKALVGLPCLTCGSNRALSALLHLEPTRALGSNPLVVLAATAWGLFAAYAAVVVLCRLPRLRLVGGGRLSRRVGIGLAVLAAVANWLYLVAAGI